MATQTGEEAGDRPTAAVTVVIPAYGVGPLIGETLDSVLAQDRGDWAVLIVNDGDRRVAGHVARYLADPRIRLLETANGGPSAARNRGIEAATTPLVALLDGDDLYEPDFLSTMIAAIEASPRIGFVTTDALYFGSDRVDERFSAWCPQTLPATLGRVITRDFNVFITTIIRREALASVGNFDEALWSSEDLDLWVRLLAAGWELGYAPRPLARYRRREDQASRKTLYMLRYGRQMLAKAIEALTGRPEQALAIERAGWVDHEIAIEEAFEQIATGQSCAGVKALTRLGVGARSARWGWALRVMRIAPFLAPLLLRLRERV